MKILLTSTSFQDTPGKHQELLEKQGFEVDVLRGPVKESVLLPIIADYDGVICGDDEYTENVLRKGKQGKLKVISKYGVGLDKINLLVANELNIPVSNCLGVNQVAVAEHVLALMFSFEKNIIEQHEITQNKKWTRLIGNEIFGQTIGIIGLGAIGKELAIRSVALGMNVLAFDVNKDEHFLLNNGNVNFTNDINDVYKEANIISLHLPHTPQTEYIINEEVIQDKLQKNPILINTSRGKLVDSKAVVKGIKNSKIRGYLTDVLITEPIEEREILVGVENIIITPHVGSRTNQTVQRQGLMAVNNLLKLIKND